MSQNSFVFAADLHLSISAWANCPTLYGDSYESLKQIVDFCVLHQRPLLLGGDVYDVKRPHPECVLMLHQQLDRMRAVGLPVYFIQGQHEMDRESPWLLSHGWPVWLDKASVKIGDATVYGMDWRPRGELQPVLEGIPPDVDVVICHQVWEDFMGIGHTDGALHEVVKDHPRIQLILTGDYHKTVETTAVREDSTRAMVISPGSTCMQEKSEPHLKYFYDIGREPRGFYTFRSIPLTTRPVVDIQIMTIEDLVRFRTAGGRDIGPDARRPAYIQWPLVRIKYLESLPDVYATIMEVGAPVDRLFLSPVRPQANIIEVNPDALPAGAFDGLSNAVHSLAATNTKAAADAVRIIGAVDQAAEIEAMYTEYRQERN
jgi:hypothetical protein